MSDNELDNLFKEAAEGFTPPQDEAAWKQMSSMLDQHAVTTAGFWNWKTISGATFIGLMAITGIWYASITHQQTLLKIETKHGANNATQGVVQEQKEQPHPAGIKNLASAKSVESKSTGTGAINRSKSNANSGATVQKNAAGNDSSNNGRLKNNPEQGQGEPEPIVVDNRITTQDERSVVNAQRFQTPGDIESKAADSLQSEVEKERVDSAVQVSETQDKKEDTGKTGPGFSIKAVISPDFSSVKFFSAGKTGINYGLLGGYSFNSRWSVFSGVIYSKKLYTSTNIEGSYSSNGHDYPVKEVDGDCRILDIPINVYYTFFPDRNFSLRAGLGFSSYIMQKEDYVYCVDNYGTDVYYHQNVRGRNNEWFKVMNLSVAISKKLTSRLSAEFEPFVKAPLAGVGEGKVSLVSMGAFINMKFDLTNNK